jgi:methylase of polypeptide subunit release factors
VVSPDDPRLRLLQELKTRDYSFTTVTPATHEIVISRLEARPPSLREIFGWNRPFAGSDLDPALLALLERAEALEENEGLLRSRLRVASLGADLFLHSAFPTQEADAVFFGPDSYRFARFIRQQMPVLAQPAAIVDMGAGSGVGGIVAARSAPGSRVMLVDCNQAALDLAQLNAAAAGVDVELVQSDQVPRGADLMIANPPYLVDPLERTYRNGGGLLGAEVALAWLEQALERLNPGGAVLLYTGAAFVDGEAPLLREIGRACDAAGAQWSSDEIDVDVFGDELSRPAYGNVERIAALGIVVQLA